MPITDEELKKIVEMRKNRVTCKEIGAMYNLTGSAIMHICRRRGVSHEIRKHRLEAIIKCIERGLTIKQTAEKIGCSRTTIQQIVRLHGLEFNREKAPKVKIERPAVEHDLNKQQAIDALKAMGLS